MNSPPSRRCRHGSTAHRAALALLIALYTVCLTGVASLLLPEAPGVGRPRLAADGPRRPSQHAAGQTVARSPERPRPVPAAPKSRRASPSWDRGRSSAHSARSVRRSPRLALRPKRERIARSTPAGRQQLRMVIVPPRPLVTWAHPPDPSLPPECRPRNPVVVSQF